MLNKIEVDLGGASVVILLHVQWWEDLITCCILCVCMFSGDKQGRPGRYRKKSRRRTISQGEGKMETTVPGAEAEVEEEEAGKGKGKGKGKAEQEVKVSFVAIDTQNYHPKTIY